MTDPIIQVRETAEEVLGKAAIALNKLELSTHAITTFTDDFENIVWLIKEDNEGSFVQLEIEETDLDTFLGGFNADMSARTQKDSNGQGLIDATITISLSRNAIQNNTVNIAGVKRAIEVFVEGYVHSIQVLYLKTSSL